MTPSSSKREDRPLRGSTAGAPNRAQPPDLPVWLNAAQAIGLLAFRRLLSEEDTYPEPEFGETRQWTVDRSQLLNALRSCAENQSFEPPIVPGLTASPVYTRVQELTRDTAMGAVELASELEADLHRIEANYRKVQEARQRLCAAVRDKRIKVRGRKGTQHDGTFTSEYKWVRSVYFLDPVHTITVEGWATIDPDVPSNALQERCRQRGRDWGVLRFFSAEIVKLMDADGEGETGAKLPAISHTGLPGRPTKSRQLLDEEFERRLRTSAVQRTASGEAAELLNWLATEHPKAERPTVHVIRNAIMARHRAWRGRA